MKKLILGLFMLSIITTQGQYKKAELGKTNYKKGFSYYDSRGVKCTLVKWEKQGQFPFSEYRWKTRFEFMGVSTTGWTDDCWIDLYTGKAFLNEQTHEITYYDEVDIIPKNKKQ